VETGQFMLHAPFPPSNLTQVFLDFDGTITRIDVIDELIRRFAIDDSWREIEVHWSLGRIGSEECLRRELNLLRITEEQLRVFLDDVPIDPGAERLFHLLGELRVPVSILSDGIHGFIAHILKMNRISPPPIFANQIQHRVDRLSLMCPLSSETCDAKAAHCKCASARRVTEEGRTVIYVGDGRSDICAARKASIRFAKGTLASLLSQERLDYFNFETLNDVAAIFERHWIRGEVSAA